MCLSFAPEGSQARFVLVEPASEASAVNVALSCAPFSSFDIFAGGLNIPLPKVLNPLRQRVSPMAHIAKKATQDGTFTVYDENRPVAWELTSSAADILIEGLLTR